MTLVVSTTETKDFTIPDDADLIDIEYDHLDGGLYMYYQQPDRGGKTHKVRTYTATELANDAPIPHTSVRSFFTSATHGRDYTGFCQHRQGSNNRFDFINHVSDIEEPSQIAKISILDGNFSPLNQDVSFIKPTGYKSVHLRGIDVRTYGNGKKFVVWGNLIHSTNTALTRPFLKVVDVPVQFATAIQLTDTEFVGPGGKWDSIALDDVNDIVYFSERRVHGRDRTSFLTAVEVDFATGSFSNTQQLDFSRGIVLSTIFSRALAFDSDDSELWRIIQGAKGDGDLDTAIFRIPVNINPVFGDAETALPSIELAANLPIGEEVRDLSATDPDDVLDRLTYSLDVTTYFNVDDSGRITIASSLSNGTTYNVTVTIGDVRGGTASLDLTFIVRDFNPPVLPNLQQNWQIDEETGMNHFVGKATATHPDDTTFLYSLTGTDAASFAIDSQSGEVSAALTSYPRGISYDFKIVATDANNETAEIAVHVSYYEMVVAPHFGADGPPDPSLRAVADRASKSLQLNFNQQYVRHDTLTLNSILFSADSSIIVNNFSIRLSGNDAEFFRVSGNRIYPNQILDKNRIYVFDVTLDLPTGIIDTERVIVSVYDRNGNYPVVETTSVAMNAQVPVTAGLIVGRIPRLPSGAVGVHHWAVRRSVLPPLGPPDILGEVGKWEYRFDLDPLTGKMRVRQAVSEIESWTETLGALIRHTFRNQRGWYAGTMGSSIQFVELPVLSVKLRQVVFAAPNYIPNTRSVELPPSYAGFVADLSTANGTIYSISGQNASLFSIGRLTGFLRIIDTLDIDSTPFEIVVVARNAQGSSSVLYLTLSGVLDANPVEPDSQLETTTPTPEPPQTILPEDGRIFDGTTIGLQSNRQVHGLSHLWEHFQYISSNLRIDFVGIRESFTPDNLLLPFETTIYVTPIYTVPGLLTGELIADRQSVLYEIIEIASVGSIERQTFVCERLQI